MNASKFLKLTEEELKNINLHYNMTTLDKNVFDAASLGFTMDIKKNINVVVTLVNTNTKKKCISTGGYEEVVMVYKKDKKVLKHYSQTLSCIDDVMNKRDKKYFVDLWTLTNEKSVSDVLQKNREITMNINYVYDQLKKCLNEHKFISPIESRAEFASLGISFMRTDFSETNTIFATCFKNKLKSSFPRATITNMSIGYGRIDGINQAFISIDTKSKKDRIFIAEDNEMSLLKYEFDILNDLMNKHKEILDNRIRYNMCETDELRKDSNWFRMDIINKLVGLFYRKTKDELKKEPTFLVIDTLSKEEVQNICMYYNYFRTYHNSMRFTSGEIIIYKDYKNIIRIGLKMHTDIVGGLTILIDNLYPELDKVYNKSVAKIESVFSDVILSGVIPYSLDEIEPNMNMFKFLRPNIRFIAELDIHQLWKAGFNFVVYSDTMYKKYKFINKIKQNITDTLNKKSKRGNIYQATYVEIGYNKINDKPQLMIHLNYKVVENNEEIYHDNIIPMSRARAFGIKDELDELQILINPYRELLERSIEYKLFERELPPDESIGVFYLESVLKNDILAYLERKGEDE